MEVIDTLDRDCSALAGLFQMVINDMKVSDGRRTHAEWPADIVPSACGTFRREDGLASRYTEAAVLRPKAASHAPSWRPWPSSESSAPAPWGRGGLGASVAELGEWDAGPRLGKHGACLLLIYLLVFFPLFLGSNCNAILGRHRVAGGSANDAVESSEKIAATGEEYGC